VSDRRTDGRTDGRTELLYQYRASAAVCWRAIKTELNWESINWQKCNILKIGISGLCEDISLLITDKILVNLWQTQWYMHATVLANGNCLMFWNCACYSQQLLYTWQSKIHTHMLTELHIIYKVYYYYYFLSTSLLVTSLSVQLILPVLLRIHISEASNLCLSACVSVHVLAAYSAILQTNASYFFSSVPDSVSQCTGILSLLSQFHFIYYKEWKMMCLWCIWSTSKAHCTVVWFKLISLKWIH